MKKNNIYILIITVLIILAGYSLFKIKQPEEIVLTDDAEKHKLAEITDYEFYNFTSEYSITVKNVKDTTLEVRVSLPSTIQGKQLVKNIKYSHTPIAITKENGRDEAIFEIKNPKEETKIIISGQIRTKTYDLSNAQKNPNVQIFPLPDKRYILPEQYIESNDSEIIAQAKELQGKTKLHTVKNIYYFVQRNMRYDDSRATMGAKNMLKNRKGKCSDYAALMVALLRANGIPSRIVSGNIIDPNSIEHTWVEVYFEDMGWVEFEPTILSKNKPNFSKSPHEYMILGTNTINPVIVKLKVPVKDNRPRPDIIVIIDNKTSFLDAKTNEPI